MTSGIGSRKPEPFTERLAGLVAALNERYPMLHIESDLTDGQAILKLAPDDRVRNWNLTLHTKLCYTINADIGVPFGISAGDRDVKQINPDILVVIVSDSHVYETDQDMTELEELCARLNAESQAEWEEMRRSFMSKDD